MSYSGRSAFPALILGLWFSAAAVAGAQAKPPTQDTSKRAAQRQQPPPPTVVKPQQPPPPTVVRQPKQQPAPPTVVRQAPPPPTVLRQKPAPPTVVRQAPPPPYVVRQKPAPPPPYVVRQKPAPPPPYVVRQKPAPPPPYVVRQKPAPPPPTVVQPSQAQGVPAGVTPTPAAAIPSTGGQAPADTQPPVPSAAPQTPADTLPPQPGDTGRRRSALDVLRDAIRRARQAGLPLPSDSALLLPSTANPAAPAGAGAPPTAIQPPLDSLGRPQPGMNQQSGMYPQPGINPQPTQDSLGRALPGMNPPAAPTSFGPAGVSAPRSRASFYMLIECMPGRDVEPVTRGFYIANYRAADLRDVALFFAADSGGDYTVQLTARTTDFGGPVAGVARARLRPSGVAGKFVGVKFRFNTIAFAPGSTLAFQLEVLGGPPGGTLSYALTDDNSCPATLTESTVPPLSNALGRTVAIRITGALP